MFAKRLAQVSASPTLAVAAEAERLRRAGHDVVDFSAGEPDFPTPEHVKAAGKSAIDANFTRYTVAPGIPELREAICASYRRDYGIEVTAAEVLMTVGGKQALFNAAVALFDPGDEVITHAPYWPTIPEQAKLMGATPVIVRTRSEDGFALHADEVIAAISPRTKAIVLNSPCNPTGALISETDLTAIAQEAARRGIWVIVDVCYEKLIYEAVPHNLPGVLNRHCRDLAVICGSASKAYAMTGWRCGWTLAPAAVIAAEHAIQSHATSNVSSITQKAVVAALTGSQEPVTAMLGEYRRRRDMLYGLLTADPRLRCRLPAGAFYLFVDVGDALSVDGLRTSTDFAQALLAEARVAVTPGEAFDAPGYVRISYATSVQNLREGSRRMLEFVRKHAPMTARV